MASIEASTPDRGTRSEKPSESPEARVTRRTWLATAVLLVATFMELLDVTMANVAIPSIRQNLGASFSQAQWVVAGYALAFAVALMTGGRLGDIWGRRRAFLVGLVGFLVTSLLCGVAPTPAILVTSRILQGLAAAVMLPQVLASLSVWFPAEKRAAAFGLFGAVAGIGGLTAPLVGGALINANLFSLDWRPIFLINLPIGLITLVAAVFLIDESRSPQVLRLDPLGVLLGALGVFLVVFPLIQGRDAGWPAWIWILLGLAAPAFAFFVVVERRKARRDRSPLVDLALFRRRSFAAGLLVTLTFFAGVTAVAFILMIFLQSGLGYPPLRAGLTLVPLAFGVIVGSGISIGLSKRIGRTTLQIGCLVSMAGAVWLAQVIGHWNSPAETYVDRLSGHWHWDIVPPLGMLGLGIGLVVAPLADFVLAAAPRESTGSASGLQATMIQTGSGVGVAVLGAIFFEELVTLHHGFVLAMQRTLYQDAILFAITALLVFGMSRRGPAAAPRSAGD